VRRGEIYVADLEPVWGSEANKRRPVVIVSNNASNEVVQELGAGMVTVVPLTTNIERVYAFQVLLPAIETGLERDCKAQAEQIRAVSTNRFAHDLGAVGEVPALLMLEIDEALRRHLTL
jgi:mRNA interferase MazF